MFPLHHAVGGGYLLRTESLLGHGADPRRRNRFGKKPLDEYLLRLDADELTVAAFRASLGAEEDGRSQRARVLEVGSDDDGDDGNLGHHGEVMLYDEPR